MIPRRWPPARTAAVASWLLVLTAMGCTNHSTATNPADAHKDRGATTYPAPSPHVSSALSARDQPATGPAAAAGSPSALSIGSTPNGNPTRVPGPPTTVRAAPGGPVLTLSASSGTSGTVVIVTAGDCSASDDTYRGFFADSKALAQPNDPQLRHPLTLAPTSPRSASARYAIAADDATGTGIFEVQCGGDANATAPFIVER